MANAGGMSAYDEDLRRWMVNRAVPLKYAVEMTFGVVTVKRWRANCSSMMKTLVGGW